MKKLLLISSILGIMFCFSSCKKTEVTSIPVKVANTTWSAYQTDTSFDALSIDGGPAILTIATLDTNSCKLMFDANGGVKFYDNERMIDPNGDTVLNYIYNKEWKGNYTVDGNNVIVIYTSCSQAGSSPNATDYNLNACLPASAHYTVVGNQISGLMAYSPFSVLTKQ